MLKTLQSLLGQLKHVKGIENDLRKRRRNGLLATAFTLFAGLLTMLQDIQKLEAPGLQAYLARVYDSTVVAFKFYWQLAVTFNWERLKYIWSIHHIQYDVLGFYIILLALVIWILFRHTAFLLSASEKPFHYTFWIARFQRMEDTEKYTAISSDDPIHHMLHHDLMDMLNRRIRRFSLLDETTAKIETNPEETPKSHIHIDGYYSFQTDEFDPKVGIIKVLPRVRIGPPANASILTFPVEVVLEGTTSGTEQARVTVPDYNNIREQVYARVACEVYKQINSDVKEKVKLFPTRFLKAVALYNEATDFSNSNTLDAYDLSLGLYEKAIYYIRTSTSSILRKIILFNYLTLRSIPLAGFWRFMFCEYHHAYAKVHAGYALCKVYKHYIGAVSGRESDPLYDLPARLTDALKNLVLLHNSLFARFFFFPGKYAIHPGEFDQMIRKINDGQVDNKLNDWQVRFSHAFLNLPKDTFFRRMSLQPDQFYIEKHTQILFHTLVVLALVYIKLSARYRSQKFLNLARAVYPSQSDRNALYLLVAAELQGDITTKLSTLSKAVKANSDFEITNFQFARFSELKLRMDEDLAPASCRYIIQLYDRVLNINPGNIASLASQGYIYWLIGDLDNAEKRFVRAKAIQTIDSRAFMGQINYGLARVAFEKGRLNECYQLYKAAVFSDPVVAAYSYVYSQRQTLEIFHFDFIGLKMLQRFREFRNAMDRNLKFLKYCFHHDEILDPDLIANDLRVKLAAKAHDARILHFRFPVLVNLVRADIFNDDLFKREVTDYLNSLVLEEGDAQAGRAKVEHIYPTALKRYSLRVGTQFSYRGESVSERTINVIKGFVVNETGNAFANYYDRFGTIGYNQEAINFYEEATKADPSNKVAFYNLGIRYSVEAKNIEAFENIDEARRLDMVWNYPLHDMARRLDVRQLKSDVADQALLIRRKKSNTKVTAKP